MQSRNHHIATAQRAAATTAWRLAILGLPPLLGLMLRCLWP